MDICIIAAIADNNAIGRDNALLWHLPEDLKFFKRVTSGYPVIMGRKTFESIGKVLPHRCNIVISRNWGEENGNSLSINGDTSLVRSASFDDAVLAAGKTGAEKCFIIGGASIYTQALDRADLLYITHVHTVIEDADTFFAPIDSAVWTEIYRSETIGDPASGLEFEFTTYGRRR